MTADELTHELNELESELEEITQHLRDFWQECNPVDYGLMGRDSVEILTGDEEYTEDYLNVAN